jgi:hypothetical protein
MLALKYEGISGARPHIAKFNNGRMLKKNHTLHVSFLHINYVTLKVVSCYSFLQA